MTMRLFFLLLLTALLLYTCEASRDTSRTLDIVNRSGHRVSIYWINRWKNDELVLNTEEPILHGADSRINSYVTHEFEIQEEPHKKTGECSGPDGECLTAQFQVNKNHGQTITILEGLELELEDDKKRAQAQASNVVKECKAKFADRSGKEDPYALLEAMTECIQTSVNDTLEEKKEEIEFQAQVRSKLGEKLTVYACQDVNATTSESTENSTWTYDKTRYQVQVLLDRPASQIQLVKQFISAEECQAAEKAIKTKKVNDDGLQAKKGGVEFPKDSELARVASRIYAYVEGELDADLEVEEREELVMLHFQGKKKNADKYESHCDGKCDGSEVKHGDAIATFIMYCEMPSTKEGGGGTHFPNAGTHVKAEAGDAVFVSYVDPKTGLMDSGLTNYSVCPVTQGDEKVLTHKIRFAK